MIFDKSNSISKSSLPGVVFRLLEGVTLRYETNTNRIYPISFSIEDENEDYDAKCFNFKEPSREIGYGVGENEYLQIINGGIRNLTLEITQQCNCRCEYCIYSGSYSDHRSHSNVSMSQETALSALEFYKDHCRDCEKASVSFFGGESLIEFELIKETISKASLLFSEKPIAFNISTNGILLNNDVSKWISNHPNVSVLVTINGPTHDLYRKTINHEPTLERIMSNIKELRRNYPAVYNRQINFIANIPSLENILPLKQFYETHLQKPPILLTNISEKNGDLKILEITKVDSIKEMSIWYELAKKYFETKDKFLDRLFRAKIKRIHERRIYEKNDEIILNNCLPFRSNCFVSADGNFNICEKNATMSFGNVKEGFNYKKVKLLVRKANEAINAKCRSCWAQRLCSICFADMDINPITMETTISDKYCYFEKKDIITSLQIYSAFVLFHKKTFDEIFNSSRD